MAAGASGIDFGLLVVAADDGVMPQTREHLAILAMLGVGQGAVTISKIDRVDAERLGQVRNEVAQLVLGTFLQGMPVFFVSAAAPGDPGVEALRDHLYSVAQTMGARNTSGLFRLAVDRVFTLKGHGTVVTGTVHDGVLRLDDTVIDLRLMPSGQKLRVRSIHAQNQAAQEARAGQRCALNLGGVDKDVIARGDWIADVRCFEPSRNIDVQLQLFPEAAAALRAWSPLHIHLGASHYVAHAVPCRAPRWLLVKQDGSNWYSTSRSARCRATAILSAMRKRGIRSAAVWCWTPAHRNANAVRPSAWPGCRLCPSPRPAAACWLCCYKHPGDWTKTS